MRPEWDADDNHTTKEEHHDYVAERWGSWTMLITKKLCENIYFPGPQAVQNVSGQKNSKIKY